MFKFNADKKNRLIVYQLIILVALVLGICAYNLYIHSKIETMTERTFEEIITQQAFHFKSKFEAEKDILETMAYLVAKSKDLKQIDEATSKDLSRRSDFEYILVLNKNGEEIHGLHPNTAKLKATEHFSRILKGETVIFDPVFSKTKNSDYLLMGTPIVSGKEVIGVLLGIQPMDKLYTFFSPSFGGAGYSYVVDNNGGVIAKGISEYSLATSNNVFDILQNAAFYNRADFNTFKEDLKQDKAGKVFFDYNGQKRILNYLPLSINGWNMLSLVPEKAISKNANEIALVTMALSIFSVLVASLLMIRMYYIQRQNLERISEIAFVDNLTKAPTLAKFKLEAQRFINDHPNNKFLMVKFDIDKFKLINESLGNDMGDLVLINLAKALKDNTPGDYDRYAYLHDDEFLVLHTYEGTKDILETRDIFKEKFKRLMGEQFDYLVRVISGHYYMSIENCTSVDDAIEKANIAHRKAKEIGAELVVYDENFIKEAMRKKDIENRMNFALQNGEFKVYLQPQYILNTERVIGAEALVRWIPDNGTIVYPNDFIPIFEKNGFIIQLDWYMFEQACLIIRGWIDQNYEPIPVSVNFSRLHLSTPHFMQNLCRIADKYSIDHSLLVVEITESTILDNEATLQGLLKELHEYGFTLAMDDFGAGYSSLGLLKNILVDVIKIDKSFLSKVENQERSQAVLANVIQMAKDLNIKTVAEGVETLENVNILKLLGCDIVQGYYYAKPMPQEDFKNCL